jgi:hypothetical protein
MSNCRLMSNSYVLSPGLTCTIPIDRCVCSLCIMNYKPMVVDPFPSDWGLPFSSVFEFKYSPHNVLRYGAFVVPLIHLGSGVDLRRPLVCHVVEAYSMEICHRVRIVSCMVLNCPGVMTSSDPAYYVLLDRPAHHYSDSPFAILLLSMLKSDTNFEKK